MTVEKRKPSKPNRNDRKVSNGQEVQCLRATLAKLSQGIENKQYTLFSDLPISSRTKAGLEAAHFVEMTEIQRLSLPAALAGQDVLGAAETGSGKTLSFLIPILERLYLDGWTCQDGLGALILAPTRELAIQIFQVLRRIGCKHTLSAGLVIGGKDVRAERESIARMNILVATPGRLLQHMDQAVGFEWGGLRVLVLDEADRILDLGFSRTIDAVISALPSDRQTLLFSATQTSSVQTLARLSLTNPVTAATKSLRDNIVAQVDDGMNSVQSRLRTPASLRQHIIFTTLTNKVDHLWCFLKGHLHSKIMVFVSSCKQVRFIYETFCRLQPGIPLLHLHGKQKQPRRMTVFADFCRKRSAALIATDIAARGLDFPAVEWVVQVDCPEDAETYVHRVGRTARYNASGNSLLFLLPSEQEMSRQLQETHGFTLESLLPGTAPDRPAKPRLSIVSKLQSLCSQDPEIKFLAQKALISYIRSIFLSPNKTVFRVDGLPLDDFAQAIGLPGTPKLRFIERQSSVKNANRDMAKAAVAVEEDTVSEYSNDSTAHSNIEIQVNGSKNITGPESDDELLIVKRRDAEISATEFSIPPPTKVSRRDLLKTKKRYRAKHTEERAIRLLYDEDTGEAKEAFPFQPEAEVDWSAFPKEASAYLESTGKALSVADAADKERVREARREKRRERKRKEREAVERSSVKQVRLGNSSD